jgi:hypothetical protein
MDIVYLGLAALLTVLSLGFVRSCERLGRIEE